MSYLLQDLDMAICAAAADCRKMRRALTRAERGNWEVGSGNKREMGSLWCGPHTQGLGYARWLSSSDTRTLALTQTAMPLLLSMWMATPLLSTWNVIALTVVTVTLLRLAAGSSCVAGSRGAHGVTDTQELPALQRAQSSVTGKV
jgi:hypothetical protein